MGFLTPTLLQSIKNLKRDPLETSRKSLEAEKGGVFKCQKSGKGDPSAFEWFCLSCKKL